MNSALLIPQISVGPLKLGDDIENYADRQMESTNSILGVSYHSYSFGETPMLAFTDENNRIESVHCATECLWRGANLIGMKLADFESLAGQSHSDEVDHIWIGSDEDGQLQEVYEYDDLGLQIWVFAAVIVTVIASDYRD